MSPIRLWHARPRLTAVGTAFTAVLLSSALITGVTHANPSTVQPVSSATTRAWVAGNTVTIQYSQNYYCDTSITAAASSGCEVGAPAQVGPTGQNISTMQKLYVIVPLFSGVDPATLQCQAGGCVNHPMNLDLSRIFGSGAASVSLPAHSHILDGSGGGWWSITVVGVTSPSAWDTLTGPNGRSLDTLRAVQASDGATGDIASNLFLFFNVVGH